MKDSWKPRSATRGTMMRCSSNFVDNKIVAAPHRPQCDINDALRKQQQRAELKHSQPWELRHIALKLRQHRCSPVRNPRGLIVAHPSDQKLKLL